MSAMLGAGRDLSRADAQRLAEQWSPSVAGAVAQGRPAADALTGPTRVERVRAADAARAVPNGVTGLLGADRTLWLVTVHAPMPIREFPGNPPVAPASVYTVAIDACTASTLFVAAGVQFGTG